MQTTVNECMLHVTTNEDDTNRNAKLNELKINGIIYSPNQNLQDLFKSLATVVGFDTTAAVNIPQLNRSFQRNKSNGELSPSNIIIAKFVAKHIRDDFYSLYLRKISRNKPLSTELIGLPQGGQIIVSESLTQNNSKIFIAANVHKRAGKLAQLFTHDGIVNVKVIKTDKPTQIRSIRDLDLFIEQSKQPSDPEAPKDANSMESGTS